mmetsp:Transcript_19259/g.42818  ORF Transcript_19259/g.42818 Transcript_19259/m.42818 type:complete len:235 (-) Transcript_19259:28-732(-)
MSVGLRWADTSCRPTWTLSKYPEQCPAVRTTSGAMRVPPHTGESVDVSRREAAYGYRDEGVTDPPMMRGRGERGADPPPSSLSPSSSPGGTGKGRGGTRGRNASGRSGRPPAGRAVVRGATPSLLRSLAGGAAPSSGSPYPGGGPARRPRAVASPLVPRRRPPRRRGGDEARSASDTTRSCNGPLLRTRAAAGSAVDEDEPRLPTAAAAARERRIRALLSILPDVIFYYASTSG